MKTNTHVCPWWLAYAFDNPIRRLFHDPEKMFSSLLKEGMKAVDIGCGMGYFSIGMAKMVGDTGCVISVDLQQKMLDILRKRAQKAGVAHRLRTFLCDEGNIGITDEVDFALTFWMVHETPDIKSFLKQVHSILKKSGKLLLAEPRMHVDFSQFAEILSYAKEVGFKTVETPPIRFSWAALLEK